MAEHESPLARLTDREREVLIRMGQGMTNQQIAAELFLSVSSIKLHIRSVFKKLDIRNRAGAAAFAAREGLLEPEVGNSSSRSDAKMACVE